MRAVHGTVIQIQQADSAQFAQQEGMQAGTSRHATPVRMTSVFMSLQGFVKR